MSDSVVIVSGARTPMGGFQGELAGATAEEALRLAVGAGAASTLEVGAGRFDPREIGRLAAGVELVELAPVG